MGYSGEAQTFGGGGLEPPSPPLATGLRRCTTATHYVTCAENGQVKRLSSFLYRMQPTKN